VKDDICFNHPFEAYRDCPGVNASLLCEFARSPAHAIAYLEEAKKETKPFKLGTLTHRFLLQPELGACGVEVRPDTYLDEKTFEEKKWNGNAKVCKRWLKDRADKTVITSTERKDICGMLNSIQNHPLARSYFENGESEVSLFAPFTLGGTVMRKGRLDHIPPGNVIADLKTCVDARKPAFERDISNYKYHLKAAYYLDLANDLGLKKEVFIFVCVEKQPPYAVACYQLDIEAIQRGRGEYIRLLQRYMECVELGKWPAYPEGLEIVSLPAWSKEAA
jgi:hypothetical protein